jgi:pentatricopeptide repeat protein
MVNTLAAAYAEAGQFDKAVSTQKEAIASLKDAAEIKDFESRLILYQASLPFHQSAK